MRLYLFLILAMLPLTSRADGEIPMVRIVPERLPDLNIPRGSNHVVCCQNGEITIFGGHTTGFVPTPTAEYLSGGEWHLIPMTYPHDMGLCVPLSSGKVLLGGGAEQPLGIGQLFSTEVYDPYTHTFGKFGCLDRKRFHATGLEVDSGRVLITGNWYTNDGIELYDTLQNTFTFKKETSQARANPYLFHTSDGDVMILSGCTSRGDTIHSAIVDRLKGNPFVPSLLKDWHPFFQHYPPVTDACLISDTASGNYDYLMTFKHRDGRMAIVHIRDTVFQLLPTVSPIPLTTSSDSILWFGSLLIDRQHQRAYQIGRGRSERKYVLAIDYARTPAPLTLYYTDLMPDMGTPQTVLTPEGNLVFVGGGSFFEPFSTAWLIRFHGQPEAFAGTHALWPWILLAGLIVLAFLAYLIIYKRRNPASESEGESEGQVHDSSEKNQATCPPDSPRDEQLMQRIIQLMEEQRPYLDSDLKQADVATALGVRLDEVSRCINSYAFNFSQFVNGYRIEYAKQLMLRKPGIKMTQVAIESGFSSDRTFYRAFNTIVGMPPSDWISQKTTDKL